MEFSKTRQIMDLLSQVQKDVGSSIGTLLLRKGKIRSGLSEEIATIQKNLTIIANLSEEFVENKPLQNLLRNCNIYYDGQLEFVMSENGKVIISKFQDSKWDNKVISAKITNMIAASEYQDLEVTVFSIQNGENIAIVSSYCKKSELIKLVLDICFSNKLEFLYQNDGKVMCILSSLHSSKKVLSKVKEILTSLGLNNRHFNLEIFTSEDVKTLVITILTEKCDEITSQDTWKECYLNTSEGRLFNITEILNTTFKSNHFQQNRDGSIASTFFNGLHWNKEDVLFEVENAISRDYDISDYEILLFQNSECIDFAINIFRRS